MGPCHLHRLAPYWLQQNERPPGPPDADDEHNDGPADEADRGDERDGATPRRDRQRVKEADEVKLLSFPQGTAWRAWRANTIHAIVSAAGRHDDKALEWIMEVETHEAA